MNIKNINRHYFIRPSRQFVITSSRQYVITPSPQYVFLDVMTWCRDTPYVSGALMGSARHEQEPWATSRTRPLGDATNINLWWRHKPQALAMSHYHYVIYLYILLTNMRISKEIIQMNIETYIIKILYIYIIL